MTATVLETNEVEDRLPSRYRQACRLAVDGDLAAAPAVQRAEDNSDRAAMACLTATTWPAGGDGRQSRRGPRGTRGGW